MANKEELKQQKLSSKIMNKNTIPNNQYNMAQEVSSMEDKAI